MSLVTDGRRLVSGFPLLLAVAVGSLLAWQGCGKGQNRSTDAGTESFAFGETYLNAVNGQTNSAPRGCIECHGRDDLVDPEVWKFLARRAKLGRAGWAGACALEARCGTCHVLPDPRTLPGRSWDEVMTRMADIMKTRKVPDYPKETWQDLRHFYFTYSRETQPALPPDPVSARSPVHFEKQTIGTSFDERERPWICHVKCADLDRDQRLDVLVCDAGRSSVNWIHQVDGVWTEEQLAEVPFPDHVEVLTNSANGSLDLVVACQTEMSPTDEPIGSVVLLKNDGTMHFTVTNLVDQVRRVADVQPVDLNGDGRADVLLAAYGYILEGEVAWLEQTAAGFEYHPIVKRTGAISVLPADLNLDGRMDFIALFAQEHEMVSAFVNQGGGVFHEKVLFKAATPSFGSSGIQLVDLDNDGDLDVLYTNGDNMDLPGIVPRAFHGVQWLENKGGLVFEWHNIRRLYGAYSAVAADLNGDGYRDIVVTSMFNDWKDPKRVSLMWLQNDGHQKFEPFGIATEPIHLISCAVGDLDGDGRPDIIAGSMNVFAPFPVGRIGRVTLWKNAPPSGISLRSSTNR